MGNAVTSLDLTIIVLYMIGILVFGVSYGRFVRTPSEFYMASKKLPWWATSLAFVTVVISAHDMLTYSETGYVVGLSAFQPYISITGFVFLFIALCAPIYYFSGIYSVPEYLEKRYDTKTRLAGSIALFIFLTSLMSFNFYAVGVLCNILLGWPIFNGMMIAAIITTLYTAAGGVVSVILTDVIQAVFILAGGLYLAIAGLIKAGGFHGIAASLPNYNLHYSTALNDPGFPSFGMWSAITIIVAAFYISHQGNLQKCLAARNMNGSRLTMLVYGLVLLPFGVVFTGLPGIIYRALSEQGVLPALEQTNQAFPALLSAVAPPGIFGLVMAGVIAAMMSTSDTYINSSATIFVNDIYSRFIKPGQTQKHYLLVARITSVIVGIGIPIVYMKYFMKIPYLMAALYSITPAVMPGLLLAVILGMYTTKIKSTPAFWSIILSIVGVFLAIFIPDVFLKPFVIGATYPIPGQGWFNSFVGLIWGIAALVIFSIFAGKENKTELDYFGLVKGIPDVKLMREAYYYAVSEGKKGIIELDKETIKEIYRKNKAF